MCFKDIRIKNIRKEEPPEFKNAIAGYLKHDTEDVEDNHE
jgi:hypothetical protein